MAFPELPNTYYVPGQSEQVPDRIAGIVRYQVAPDGSRIYKSEDDAVRAALIEFRERERMALNPRGDPTFRDSLQQPGFVLTIEQQ